MSNSLKTVDLFSPTESGASQSLLRIDIPGRLPSWNQILGMEHWSRHKLKSEIQDGFLSALRASASDSSTKTTSVKSIMSIAADTLESYREITRKERASRSAKKKLEKASRSSQE